MRTENTNVCMACFSGLKPPYFIINMFNIPDFDRYLVWTDINIDNIYGSQGSCANPS